jgi:hypothetical protein
MIYMTASQLLHLAGELQKISKELLDVSMTTNDTQAGLRVGKANLKLCEINKTLVDHLLEQVEES